jgi:orotidine-5'-phosphate decarboxylase
MIDIFFPVDMPSYDAASDMVSRLEGQVHLKFGYGFMFKNGPQACGILADVWGHQAKIAADVKMHDIPATTAEGVRSLVEEIQPWAITIWASSPNSLRAAVEAANECEQRGYRRPKLLGVTTLTSDEDEGYYVGSDEEIANNTQNAIVTELDGLVCPSNKIQTLKAQCRRFGRDMFMFTPGIRSAGVDVNDQVRVATPREAMEAGSDALVIGREIRNSADPLATVLAIKQTLG